MNKGFFLPKVRKNLVKTNNSKVLSELAYCSSEDARQKLDFKIAFEHQALPLKLAKHKDTDYLTVAVNKDCPKLKKDLEFITSCFIKMIPVENQDLGPAIFKAYKGDDSNLDKSKKLLLKNAIAKKIAYQTRASNPESKFIENLLEYAIAKEASDIHILAKADACFIKLRINGELYEHPESVCNIQQQKIIINRIKILATLNISENRIPQDGSFKYEIPNLELKIRVSLMPTIYGEKAVLRLQKLSNIKNIEELGFDSFTIKSIKKALQNLSGLILFCGPTGSGKTSSMYAVLNELQGRNCSIVSIEDPVEINMPAIDQSSIAPEIGLDYQKALKSILRQDPDVLLIGEIRDKQSAEIVLQAALSGHLILSTVHAGNVFQVISRLIQLELKRELIAEALKLIINQRLVPTVCQKCKGAGCEQCNFIKYQSRQVITEALFVNNSLRRKIAENNFSVHNVKNSNLYQSLKGELEKLYKAGAIDLKTYQEYNE